MSLSKTSCLILTSNSEAMYLDEIAGPRKQIIFKLDPTKVIVNIVMQEMYVIIVYESSVAVYNSTKGDFLEEKAKLDKSLKYKFASANFAGTELYLVAQNSSSGKNIV